MDPLHIWALAELQSLITFMHSYNHNAVDENENKYIANIYPTLVRMSGSEHRVTYKTYTDGLSVDKLAQDLYNLSVTDARVMLHDLYNPNVWKYVRYDRLHQFLGLDHDSGRCLARNSHFWIMLMNQLLWHSESEEFLINS